MPEFILVIVVLVLLAAVFLFMPVMMRRSQISSSRGVANVAVFKDRLNELQQERDNGLIDDAELLQLKTELERRLLDEGALQEAAQAQIDAPSKKTALLLAVLLPLFAVLLYQQTGAKPDWDITQTLQQARHKSAAGEKADVQVEQLIEQLSRRLEQRPEDPHYLMLLGSTQMQQQNYPAAADAYQRLAELLPDDASALAHYAQALYLSSNRILTDKVQAVADRALAINVQQPTVLGMLGIAHFEQGDYQQAIGYWERLLPMLGPVSPNRQMITAGIDQAKAKLRESGVAVAETPEPQANTGTASLQVQVSMGDNIQANASDTVFVFARAVAGPRMPLAVARIRVADLPKSITLDDSMAMAPGLTLSSFDQVEVVARISKRGIANPGSGDIEGRLGPIDVTASNDALALLINQIVP